MDILMRKYTLFFLILLSSRIATAQEGVWVVANVTDQGFSLTKGEVRNLFMSSGTSKKYVFDPVALSPGNRARAIFNAKIIALPESRIQSYWAQMRFSGRMTPPKEFDNLDALLNYISSTDGAIGYVPADTELPNNVAIVYRSF
ncbi:hypothetical protein KL866_19230 [Alteromonas sp. ALT199]|nr:hypothetical protein [Alteromonas sp. ALT199]